MKRHIAAALLVAMAFGLPSFAAPGVKVVAPPNHASPERGAWTNRIHVARERLAAAQNRYVTAMLSYRQMRHHRRVRGEEKLLVLALRKAARTELTAAERDLDTLLDQARRAGVPPGWLRDAMAGDNPAAPAY